MWEFLSEHPFMGLSYLLIVCMTVMVCVAQISKFSPWSNVVDDGDGDEPEEKGSDSPPSKDNLH